MLGASPCAQAEATNFLAKQDTPVLQLLPVRTAKQHQFLTFSSMKS